MNSWDAVRYQNIQYELVVAVLNQDMGITLGDAVWSQDMWYGFGRCTMNWGDAILSHDIQYVVRRCRIKSGYAVWI